MQEAHRAGPRRPRLGPDQSPRRREELQRLTDKPVLAVQHLDPFEPLARPPEDTQGYLRVGVIGARNNVNRMNIGEFLREAEPIFRDAFAPVKIVIAGSVCELLEDAAGPFVELVGLVDDVEDFYRSVDCVAVPMRRSTGLKIKTGEALSFGLPVLSLAHAFEGYEPANTAQALACFMELAVAIVELSFAPRAQLQTRADASAQSHRKTAAVIARSFRRSDVMALEQRGLVVIAVDSRSLADGNIFELVLRSALGVMRETAAVAVLVVRGSARDVIDNPGTVDQLRRVIVAADLPGADDLAGDLAAIGVDVFDVAQYLANAQPAIVVADAPHPGLTAGPLPRATILLRPDMVRLSDPGAPLKLALGQYGKAVISGTALSKEVAGLCGDTGATFIPAPILWSRGPLRIRRAPVNFGRKTVAILGRANGQAMDDERSPWRGPAGFETLYHRGRAALPSRPSKACRSFRRRPSSRRSSRADGRRPTSPSNSMPTSRGSRSAARCWTVFACP